MMKTSIFLIVTGIILLVVSFILRAEQITQRHKIEENKSSTAAAGALIGGTTGAVVGSSIGVIGIAACGTGVGIPVGLVMLGLGALLGAGGAAVGHAVGEADKYVTTTSPAFSPWVWGSLMLLALGMIAWGSINIWIHYKKINAQEHLS